MSTGRWVPGECTNCSHSASSSAGAARQLRLERRARDRLEPALARAPARQARREHVGRGVHPDDQVRARARGRPRPSASTRASSARSAADHHSWTGPWSRTCTPGARPGPADRVADDEQVRGPGDAVARVGLAAAQPEVRRDPDAAAARHAACDDRALPPDARAARRGRPDRRHDLGGRDALQPQRRDERARDRRLPCTGQAAELDDGAHAPTGGTRSRAGSR